MTLLRAGSVSEVILEEHKMGRLDGGIGSVRLGEGKNPQDKPSRELRGEETGREESGSIHNRPKNGWEAGPRSLLSCSGLMLRSTGGPPGLRAWIRGSECGAWGEEGGGGSSGVVQKEAGLAGHAV